MLSICICFSSMRVSAWLLLWPCIYKIHKNPPRTSITSTKKVGGARVATAAASEIFHNSLTLKNPSNKFSRAFAVPSTPRPQPTTLRQHGAEDLRHIQPGACNLSSPTMHT